MMALKIDPKQSNGPGGNFPWFQMIIFAIVCALIVGIYVWSAAPGVLDLASPRAEDAYYNLLVRGFRDGQLNLERDPSPGLVQLANPYDPSVNGPYVWDADHLSYEMTYYKGKFYLYFGVTSALVLFWPYSFLTGHYLPQKDAIVIFYSLGFLIAAGLFRAVWRRYYSLISVWIITAGVLALGLASGILGALSPADLYEVPESCGFAFVMLTLMGIWQSLHEPSRAIKWLLLASLAYGLAVVSRPSLLFGAIILLIPAVQAWQTTSGQGEWRRTALLLAAASGPITVIGLGQMLYNDLRFDNPLEFGWHYMLTSIQNSAVQQFSLHYFWFNFRFYFLEPLHWTRQFPFFEAVSLSSVPSGYGGVGTPYSGILADFPIAWLALTAPLAWKNGPWKNISALGWFVIAVSLHFLIGAVTLCLFMAGSSRYQIDFQPDLILLAAIGILGLERALASSIIRRHIGRCIWCLLLAYSIFFSILASVKAHASTNYITGNFFINQGQLEKAIGYFKKASALDPGSTILHFAFGNALSRAGQVDESILEYKKALEIKPDYAEANNNLGYTLLQNGRVTEAITYFQQAAKIQKSYQAYYNLGYAYRLNGMAKGAIDSYRQALELQPGFLPAQTSLAWILATWPDASVRNGSEAIALAEKASEFSGGKDPHILRTLAAAYAETGRFPEAIATAKQALALEPAPSNLGNELQAEIQLYQKNSPLRTTSN
jgi:tetratricopeptide (TPR) repeat protein